MHTVTPLCDRLYLVWVIYSNHKVILFRLTSSQYDPCVKNMDINNGILIICNIIT